MLFTLPGKHAVDDLFAAFNLVSQFLTHRDIDGMQSCRIAYSVRTSEGLARRDFIRPPASDDSVPDLLEDFVDSLRAEKVTEIFDLEMLTTPIRHQVPQVAEVVFDARKTRQSARSIERFRLRFRDHPDAAKLSIVDGLMRQMFGTSG